MQSPYLTQVLAQAHVDDMLRNAGRSSVVRRRRRGRSSAMPRLRDWWAGQLRRPAGGAARSAVLPGRPVTPCAGVGR